MRKRITNFGFINCMLAVILGAFAAHSLKSMLPENALNTFQIGVRYQFYHGLALIITGILMHVYQNEKFRISGILFLIGIICFSGSLYLLSLRSLFSINVNWVGPLTPIGGALFIIAWLLLIINFNKKNKI